MEQEYTCCPVCTLYLREGITLQAHLETHPKDKVIEALLKVTHPYSAQQTYQTSQPAEESVHSQPFAAPNPASGTQSSSHGNAQTQATAGTSYHQHFPSPNPSTVLSQYIPVGAPTSSPPLVPNQPIPYMPHPHAHPHAHQHPLPHPHPHPHSHVQPHPLPHPHPTPYAHSMCNPLCNPYIPHPCPVVQPYYANMPFSSDYNPLMATSQVPNPVVTPSTSQSAACGSDPVSKRLSNTATNTGLDTAPVKRKSRKLQSRSSSKMQPRLRSVSQRKSRIKKQLGLRRRRATASTSIAYRSAISPSRSQRAANVNFETNSAAETSVMAKGKSLKLKNKPATPKSSTSFSASVIAHLPVPLRDPLKSDSSSDSSSSPGQSPGPAKIVSFLSPVVVEAEDNDIEPELVEQISTNGTNVTEYTDHCDRAASSCSVIADGANATPLTSDAVVNECGIYGNLSDSESQNVSPCPQLPFRDADGAAVCDEQPEMSENVCPDFERELFVNEQDHLSDYDEEIPDKIFRSFDSEQEKKSTFSFQLENQEANEEENSVNRDEVFDGSDVFNPDEVVPSGTADEGQANESEFIEDEAPEVTEDDNTTQAVKKVSSIIFLGNSGGSNTVTPTETAPQILEARDFPEKSIICTDLEPATGNSDLENLEMAASLNLNNYMEVDGVKIFFNTASVQATPLEPFIKFSSLKSEVTKVKDKTKVVSERETLVESVIHLVSGANSKGEFSGETFQSSTSENNAEVRDLSPLSVNIRADESMPARGELSEQESLGAENTTWALFHSEVRTKSECDLMIGHEFRATILDIEDGDLAGKSGKFSFWRREGFPYVKQESLDDGPDDKSKPLILRKPRLFSCSECKQQFSSLRSRKEHIIQNHFYNFKEDDKIKLEDKDMDESDSLSKENSNESASESATESARAEKLEESDDLKSESSVKKSSDKSSCEVTRICPGCQLPFVGLKKLKAHLREVHGESKHKCGTCSEIFENEKDYNDHLRIHPLVCTECGKLFNRKPNLKLHMKRHLSVKPYSCTQCPKTFVTRQKLEEHLNGHTGKKPLKCSSCDRTFSRHSNLIQHRNLHHVCAKKKVKDFVCRCGEVFHSLRKLEWHKEVHDTKPKTCSFCSQKFIHKNSVTRHIRRSHMPHYLPKDKKDSENVQCPICGKIYLRSSLAVHMRVHNGEKPFVCNICTKSFTTKWNLELHNWTHQSRSSMPFKCMSCRSAFYREVDFTAHVNSHKNYRPFTCNICGQKFIRKYNCLRHQEEHKKEKKFVCDVPGCEKSFHRSYYLRDHMRIHTGARPHTCHICGKASSTKSNHNKHIRIHDTREPLNTEN